jgi:hypothetical protein
LKYIVDEVYRNRSENGRKNWCWTGEERRMASQIRSERKVQVYILRWVRLVDIGLLDTNTCELLLDLYLDFLNDRALSRDFFASWNSQIRPMMSFVRSISMASKSSLLKKPWKCFGAKENQPKPVFSAPALIRCEKHKKK